MKIFGNKLNRSFLPDVLPNADEEIDTVKAAIAYGNDASTLLRNCVQNGHRLDIWMRYDHTVPVSPSLLEELLRNVRNNVFCKLVPDVLHSKVIWWKNYGVYIGSANLTQRAWLTNIELGIFLSEAEMELSGALAEIELFFAQLETFKEIQTLSQEHVEEQRRISSARQAIDRIDRDTAKLRIIPQWGGPAEYVDRKSAYLRGQDAFIKEWMEALTTLRELAKAAPGFRPKWLRDDVPATWQADQFLHAYYYNPPVREGSRYLVAEFHERNMKDPAAAVKSALSWWSQLPRPPSNEDINCHVNAPTIRRLLSREAIRELSLEDFSSICRANHSTRDHVARTNLRSLGIAIAEDASIDEKTTAYASWIWNLRNRKGERIDSILHYVLDGGTVREMPTRLYEAANEPDRLIPHFRINQLAELAGWARPEHYSPRNGRTSKSLRALGYSVRVY
jgi:hypothetical protein